MMDGREWTMKAYCCTRLLLMTTPLPIRSMLSAVVVDNMAVYVNGIEYAWLALLPLLDDAAARAASFSAC